MTNTTDQLLSAAWKNLIGSWSDSGSSWTGSTPTKVVQYHWGPVRLWTTPLNTDKYGKWINILQIKKVLQHGTRLNKLSKLGLAASPQNKVEELLIVSRVNSHYV